MKANELRIGNLIFDDDGLLAKINGFQPFDHSVRCDEQEGCLILIDIYRNDGTIDLGYQIESYECKPIPITEEWLVRFGFEKKRMFPLGVQDDRTTYTLWINDTDAYFYKDSNFDELGCYASDGGDVSTIVKNIEHVHTLQNLYFALTGQELTIKEAAR